MKPEERKPSGRSWPNQTRVNIWVKLKFRRCGLEVYAGKEAVVSHGDVVVGEFRGAASTYCATEGGGGGVGGGHRALNLPSSPAACYPPTILGGRAELNITSTSPHYHKAHTQPALHS